MLLLLVTLSPPQGHAPGRTEQPWRSPQSPDIPDVQPNFLQEDDNLETSLLEQDTSRTPASWAERAVVEAGWLGAVGTRRGVALRSQGAWTGTSVSAAPRAMLLGWHSSP